MPNAVSNTTPLIYLSKLDRLKLLKIYDNVYVCSPVYEDIAKLHQKGILSRQELQRISEAQSRHWLMKKEPSTNQSSNLVEELLDVALGLGEATSMALAKEIGAVFLANDRKAIQIAKQYGIETRWYTDILQDALKAGYLKSLNDYVHILDKSIELGLYLSRTQRDKAIARASDLANRKKA